jgi:hypothetical protein
VFPHVLVVVVLHLVEPTSGASLYDRVPLDPEMTRWAGESQSQAGFRHLLDQLGRKPTVEGIDHAYMLDVPFSVPLGAAAHVVRDCKDLASRFELHEVPQEQMEKADRGVWRTYVLVVRGGRLDPGRISLLRSKAGTIECRPFEPAGKEEKP